MSNRETSVLHRDKENFSESKFFFALKNEFMLAEMYALLYIYILISTFVTCLGALLHHCLFFINSFYLEKMYGHDYISVNREFLSWIAEINCQLAN